MENEAQTTTIHPNKVLIWQTFKASWKGAFSTFSKTFFWGLPGIIVLLGLSFMFASMFPESANKGANPQKIAENLSNFCGVLLMLPISIALQRFILIGEAFTKPYFKWFLNKIFWRVFFFVVGIFAVVVIAFLISGALGGALAYLAGVKDIKALLASGGGAIVLMLPFSFYVSLRLYPTVALIATGHDHAIKKAWAITKGNLWRILSCGVMVNFSLIILSLILGVISGFAAGMTGVNFAYIAVIPMTLFTIFSNQINVVMLCLVIRQLPEPPQIEEEKPEELYLPT